MIALLGQIIRVRRRDTELLFTVSVIVLGVVVMAVIASVFLSALTGVPRRVHTEYRRMEPGHVWLNLIPVFTLAWATVTVERIAKSLRNEFIARSLRHPSERYGRRSGLTALVLLVSTAPLYPIASSLTYWRSGSRSRTGGK